jgi:hypothetical protein
MTKQEKKPLSSVLRATEYLFLENIALKLVLEHREVPNWSSRVVSNLSLVRPANWFWSSRTTEDSSEKPVVTEPMISAFAIADVSLP